MRHARSTFGKARIYFLTKVCAEQAAYLQYMKGLGITYTNLVKIEGTLASLPLALALEH